MNKEIERKYAIKYIPDDLKIEKVMNIEQAYIYHDKNTLIRIRKNELLNSNMATKYIYTVKTKGDIKNSKENNISSKYEIESNIEKEYYEKLLKSKISNIINKTRIVAPISNNLKAEIDIYYDYLEGLVTLEVEFPTEKEAAEFEKSDWIGEELGFKELSNGKLSMMSKEEFESIVTNDFMENNKKVIKTLLEKI